VDKMGGRPSARDLDNLKNASKEKIMIFIMQEPTKLERKNCPAGADAQSKIWFLEFASFTPVLLVVAIWSSPQGHV